jgi:AraC-like DNA-binding protein
MGSTNHGKRAVGDLHPAPSRRLRVPATAPARTAVPSCATASARQSRDRFAAVYTDMVALSVSQFAHAFKAEYGVSPYRYVIVRRIERAKTLLGTTDHNIASIAQRVGFTSQAKLSESFGKIVGVTPTAYRHAGSAPASEAFQ